MVTQNYTIKDACAALDLPRSTYYRHKSGLLTEPRKRQRRTDEADLVRRMSDLKAKHPFWGYRRIWA
jgi:putative transposase